MGYNSIRVQFVAGIATITLDRPEKRNALSYKLIDELQSAFDEVARSPAQVILLTGAGTAFCAGMDLENLEGLAVRSPEQNLQDSETIARLFRALYDFPKPTIAAVNGAAIGGGVGLATLCDFTLATPEAKFGYTEVRIGFIPAIVSVFLLRQVGEKRARDLLLSGRLFSAEEAQRFGLINEIVPADRLMEKANETARQIMQNSPLSLQATKRLLSEYSRVELDGQITAAVRENAAIRTTNDFREGISAFLEKRKPYWGNK
jgi:methylglutaconyl-CoA hydratase